jgi:hypothetical protein
MGERPILWPRAWGAPRLLTRNQVRSYLQITDADLVARMARGQVPGPLWGTDADLADARWDRQAVDRALDRASAIPSIVDAGTEELDRAFGTGRRGR